MLTECDINLLIIFMDRISNENSTFFISKPPPDREHLTRVGCGTKEAINQILKPAEHGGFFYG